MRSALFAILLVVSACGSGEAPADLGESHAAVVPRAESDLPAPPVLGHAAVLPGGRRVEARRGAEPGESDLFLVDADGKATPLAPAAGPDELPLALADGRVAFVSGRSTVASIWIVDPNSGALAQLTNRGLVAGKPWRGFAPPPARDFREMSGALAYDDGSGRRWRVHLANGRGEEESR